MSNTGVVKRALTKERLINWGYYDLTTAYQSLHVNYWNRRVPNGTHGGVRGRRLITASYSIAEKSGLKDIMKMEKAQEQEYSLMLKREYGNPCSSPKKFILFCRKLLFLESKNINWEANAWFTERLNISAERYSRSDAVESFSFLDIHLSKNF